MQGSSVSEGQTGNTERFSAETRGLFYGFLGVLAFSFTLPMTRMAVRDLDPTFVGLGRAVVAAVLAAITLTVTRQAFPTRRQIFRLMAVAGGVVIGFPLLSAWALRFVPASHGAIVLGMLPLVTAIVSTIWDGDRPAPMFWVAAVIGCGTVIAFVLITSGDGLVWGDVTMMAAVLIASVGYVEGGRLSREMGSWQTISWALIVGAPILIIPVGVVAVRSGVDASAASWLGFAYVSVFSMFLGFFAWYRGLALGGIARVGQVQLIQAFLTFGWSALLLGEKITPGMLVAAAIVIVMIAVIRRVPIEKKRR